MARPKRSDLAHAIRALFDFLVRTQEELRHVEPKRILVVAGEARRASHATVTPLAFEGRKRRQGRRLKPLVKVNGRRMLYLITLRPLFFRASTPRERVATLLHELLHVSEAFDGTLETKRRHGHPGGQFSKLFKPLEKRCWKALPATLVEPFAHDGEVLVPQWLERPSTWLPVGVGSQRDRYGDEHLFDGVVRMKTRLLPKKLRRRQGPEIASPGR